TALKKIDVASVQAAPDKVAELQAELGSDFFKVMQVDDTQVLVRYTNDISGSAPAVTAATGVADFFGNNAATNYLSKITSLSGSASAHFAAGSQFTVTFGADSGGFFVNSGTVFSGDLSASLNLSGHVNVGQIAFDVSVTGTGTIDLKGL